MLYNIRMTTQELYDLIQDNPGISESEVRKVMNQPELFYDPDVGDELDKLLADCDAEGLYLTEDANDCLYVLSKEDIE